MVSGPSGSGKSTICKELVKRDEKIRLSVSATTRAPRAGEQDGISYFFLSQEEFSKKIDAHAFYEYAHVYGNYYGTLKAPVEQMLHDGYDVILEIEMQGARQIRAKSPETVLVFIMPPSLEALSERLKKRNTETEEQIRLRFESACGEIAFNKDYDHILVNDRLEETVSCLLDIIRSYRTQDDANK